MYSNFDFLKMQFISLSCLLMLHVLFVILFFLDYECDRDAHTITIDVHCIEFRYILIAVFEFVSFPNFHSRIENGKIVLKYLG